MTAHPRGTVAVIEGDEVYRGINLNRVGRGALLAVLVLDSISGLYFDTIPLLN